MILRSKTFYISNFILALLLLMTQGLSAYVLDGIPEDLSVLVGDSASWTIKNTRNEELDVRFDIEHKDLISIHPENASLLGKANETFQIHGLEAGHASIVTNVSSQSESFQDIFVRVTVLHSTELYYVSAVIGWIYFVAWSISFYPQIYDNWKRKSVVGLNFDFLALNIVGFLLYSLFNCGLYFIDEIEQEYFKLHSRGLNPVMLNDIVFSLHASFATFITIVQCCMYERADQRVSTTAMIILGVFALFLCVSAILGGTFVISWLDFLYYCSYVKLGITLIKYIPQAYMNYKRKSTVGWSIGNIFLDFTGGMLSMLQMILNAYNYNDWESIFGDPTKFGLGLFSVVFDIFFMIQHYVLYGRRASYEKIEGINDASCSVDPDAASAIYA